MSVAIETTKLPLVTPIQKEVPIATRNRLPEFSLAGKVILVSGAARGLGLVQTEGLLEAGAKVYALDRLPEPVSKRKPSLSLSLSLSFFFFFFLLLLLEYIEE